MTKFAPSILSADFARMGEEVAKLKDYGADYIHCDVMDGVYVPNITFGMPMIKSIRPYTDLPIDAHLMISKPEKYVERFCDAGADIVTFHPEASDNVLAALSTIKAKGKKCGLALNPDKNIELIEPYFDMLDMIVIMSVYPGFGGQKFIPDVLTKAKKISEMIEKSGKNIELEIDGGVCLENVDEIKSYGLNVLVAGSAFFGAIDKTFFARRIKK